MLQLQKRKKILERNIKMLSRKGTKRRIMATQHSDTKQLQQLSSTRPAVGLWINNTIKVNPNKVPSGEITIKIQLK